MEAVAVASAIVGLLSFGYDLVNELVAYGEEDYRAIFGIDQDGHGNRGQGFFTMEALIRIRNSFDRCTVIFQELRKELHVACSMTEQERPYFPPQFRASDRVQWHFRKPRVVSLIDLLDKLKADLHARLLILYISYANRGRSLQIQISGVSSLTISELTSRAAALYNYSQQNGELTNLPNGNPEDRALPAPHPGGGFSQDNTQPCTPTAIRPAALITVPPHNPSNTYEEPRRTRTRAAVLDFLVVACQKFTTCVLWSICTPCMLYMAPRRAGQGSIGQAPEPSPDFMQLHPPHAVLASTPQQSPPLFHGGPYLTAHESPSSLILTPARWAEGPSHELREKARCLLNDEIGAVSEKYHIHETESQPLVDNLISQWIVGQTESTTNETGFSNDNEPTLED
ncbi:hypothetical protein B0J15DRAFT_472298 [Fusarium solani]|uniref:Uncharacterized protein n=1 Tax=Fusarium solani TaxID=169388 RepID=A0A9P9G716_FUSSL|nr:uncharacterized protein B0J15DRAFT_472298 [Fusarium solani]KAH7232449.1 hypothetical protein B0J15DRAFT_472298 [Fusarium solani]